MSLDLRIAREVCRSLGLPHYTVMLDAEFRRHLRDLTLEAARLTGGVSSISQTADLYLYKMMGGSYRSRISGNLGNQVGRGGVESLSAHAPDERVLSHEVRQRLRAKAMAPWFIGRLSASNYGDLLFGEEVHYWSIPNYMVGSDRTLQLTPYADRRLMQLSRVSFGKDPQLQQPTWKALRARDLRHRLAGTPGKYSFQRQFLIGYGAKAARVPLNWGWLAAGGWSPRWFASAMVSAADAAVVKFSKTPGPMRPLAAFAAARSSHRSALADWPQLLRQELRELALDSLGSQRIADAGIFDPSGLEKVMREHFSGAADHHHTVVHCLEIALGFLTRTARR